MNIHSQECKIVQLDTETNAFVVTKNESELFRISFPKSIIRKFIPTMYGYILHFQCRSFINSEKGNVCMVLPNGDIRWWAERKRSDDCYVELNVNNEKVIGYDGSYNCYFDINTGKIQKREFIK